MAFSGRAQSPVPVIEQDSVLPDTLSERIRKKAPAIDLTALSESERLWLDLGEALPIFNPLIHLGYDPVFPQHIPPVRDDSCEELFPPINPLTAKRVSSLSMGAKTDGTLAAWNRTAGQITAGLEAPDSGSMASSPPVVLAGGKATVSAEEDPDSLTIAGEIPEKKAGFARLSAMVTDNRTRQPLASIAVEVYHKLEDGRMLLAYTGIAHAGNFNIPLLRGMTHVVILTKVGYKTEAFYIHAEDDLLEQEFIMHSRTPDKQEHSEEAILAAAGKRQATTGFLHTDGSQAHADNPLPAEPAKFASWTETSVLDETTVEAPDFSSAPSADSSVLAPISTVRVDGDKTDSLENAPANREKKVSDTPDQGELVPAEGLSEASTVPLGTYQLTKSTSFREEPTHRSGVMVRFQPGDQVEVLEKTEYHWWKVRFDGRVGYVKALLLEEME